MIGRCGPSPWRGVWLPLLMGILFLGIGLSLYASTYRDLAGTLATSGTVIAEVEHENHDDNGHTYSPEVTYVVGGKEYRIEGSVNTYPPRYRVGEGVKVRYRAGEPSKARIDSFYELWLMPLLFSMVGIAMVIGAIASAVRAR